ncbi:MAG: hypothetical protein HKP01_10965, partial [Gemmatimonadetes bacterium]|nr:hypothetical protein [Gemmatimonadota bacterium]
QSDGGDSAETAGSGEVDVIMEAPFPTGAEPANQLIHEDERHFAGLTQLTFGGQNAEAYWSTDDDWIMFQATPREAACDQQFTMRSDGSDLSLVSTGMGRTTCGYFFPGNEKIVYGSTHLGGEECPPEADMSQGYVWALYQDYDIFVADAEGSNLERLTDAPGYDAEATMSRDGEWIVFTSARDGDLEIYKMRIDGSELTRLTDTPGYDGGPFFSYDGTKIIYRASHPEGDELADYQSLLAQGLIRPSQLDIFVMDADGSNKRQLTDNGAANFGPYFFPDGQRIIFSSNLGDQNRREFDLWAINVDGTGLERITFSGDFDGFPMFNSDGTKLIFASNRGNELPRETNLFIADWVD